MGTPTTPCDITTRSRPTKSTKLTQALSLPKSLYARMADTAASEPCPLVPCKRARSASVTSETSLEFDGQHVQDAATTTPGLPGNLHLPMKRRVNPDSLASRLDPELVREMNVLIATGNGEMPSFAIRKVLQERYNIDRRHIYDYFHSMGLRVVKHEKQNNLASVLDRPRLMKPRPIRQAPRRGLHFQQETKSDGSALRDPFTASSRPRRSVKGQGQKRSRTSERPKLVLSSSPASAGHFVTALESPKSPSPDGNTNVGVNHLPPSPDSKYTFTRLNGNRVSSFRRPNNFDLATHLRETQFDPVVYMIPELDLSSADKNHETDRSLSLELPLSQSERLSLYEFLDGNIRPANGIEESVGSYKSYMADQSRHYYQRLFPGSTQTSRYVEGVNSSAGGMQDTVNFRKWLVSVPQANSTSSCAVNKKTALSPCSTPRKQGRSSNCDIHITHSHLEEDFIFSFSPEVTIDDDHCLDALFPNMLSSDAVSGFNAAWGSPVVRSRITKAVSTMSTGEYHGDFTSQGDIVSFRNPLATDSVCQESGTEERFLLSAPSFSLSRRLRTGHSLCDDNRTLRTQLTVDIDCDKHNTGPCLPFKAPSPRSVLAPCTPRANRLRSRSLSAFPTRSRTISAGGGI